MRKGKSLLSGILCLFMIAVFVLVGVSCSVQDREEQIKINSIEKLMYRPGTKEPCQAVPVEDAAQELKAGEVLIEGVGLPDDFQLLERSIQCSKDENGHFSVVQGDNVIYMDQDGNRVYIARAVKKDVLGNMTVYTDNIESETKVSYINGVEMEIFGDEEEEVSAYFAQFYVNGLYCYVDSGKISKVSFIDVLRALTSDGEEKS